MEKEEALQRDGVGSWNENHETPKKWGMMMGGGKTATDGIITQSCQLRIQTDGLAKPYCNLNAARSSYSRSRSVGLDLLVSSLGRVDVNLGSRCDSGSGSPFTC